MAATTPNTYIVRVEDTIGAEQDHTIQASGFDDEGSFTTFTNAEGQKVYAVRTDRLVSVKLTSGDS